MRTSGHLPEFIGPNMTGIATVSSYNYWLFPTTDLHTLATGPNLMPTPHAKPHAKLYTMPNRANNKPDPHASPRADPHADPQTTPDPHADRRIAYSSQCAQCGHLLQYYLWDTLASSCGVTTKIYTPLLAFTECLMYKSEKNRTPFLLHLSTQLSSTTTDSALSALNAAYCFHSRFGFYSFPNHEH